MGFEREKVVDGVEYGWPAGWLAPGGVFDEWKAGEGWAGWNDGWARCDSDARRWKAVEFDRSAECCSANRGMCSGPVEDEDGPSAGERDGWPWLGGDSPDGGVGYRFGLNCCR